MNFYLRYKIVTWRLQQRIRPPKPKHERVLEVFEDLADWYDEIAADTPDDSPYFPDRLATAADIRSRLNHAKAIVRKVPHRA